MTGPLGVLYGQFGWIANPLMLFAALKKVRKSGFALIAVVLAAAAAVVLVAVTAFSFTSEWGDGGGDFVVCSFGLGYYLWLACSILVLIAALLKSADRYDVPAL